MKINLTPQQQKAVEYCDGPLLIVAGPGTGKTRVLTQKAIYLIDKLNYDPKSILMTTFTVKASEEIRQRVEDNTKKDITSMFIGTVHSLCENIIKEHAGAEIYTQFEIVDDFKRYLFIKKNMEKLKLNLDLLKKIKRVKQTNELIVLLTKFYDTITENIINTDELRKDLIKSDLVQHLIGYNKKKNIEIDEHEAKDLIVSVIKSYELYRTLLEENKYLDFASLESFTWNILSKDDTVKLKLKEQYKYVLIDEFQDINPIQWKILKNICGEKIACVGDKNQSIYGFRGSNPNIFEYFLKEYPTAIEIKLESNFRSKKQIVDLSNSFLEVRKRPNINLNNERSDETKIFHLEGDTEEETTRKIITFVIELKNKKIINSYSEVAILFRSVKYHGVDFFKLLDTEFEDISYTVYGGNSFIENEEIRAILFLMSYVYSVEDIKIIGEVTFFRKFHEVLKTNLFECKFDEEKVKDYDWPFFLKKKYLMDEGFDESIAEKIVKINNLREKISEKSDYSLQNSFYELLGILDIMEYEKKGHSLKILYNLGRFSEIIEDYVNMYGKQDMLMFLKILNALPENVNLNRKSDEIEIVDNDSLFLMNIHQAKGLEFPVIIIPSLTSRRIPKLKETASLIDIPKKFYLYTPYSAMREEENLFYVAITRARDALVLSYFEKYNSGISVKKSPFYEAVEHSIRKFENKYDDIKIVKNSKDDSEIKLVDYSAISTFIDCQERFKINYIYGFKATEIFTQKIGLIYHNSIAKINSLLQKKEFITDTKIDLVMKDSWIELGETKNNIWRHKIKLGLKRYSEFMKKDLKDIIGIEKPVSVMKDKIRIRGRADIVYENQDGKVIVMDYKSRKLKSIEETHTDIQLKFYYDALVKDGQKIDKAIAYPIEEENLNIKDAVIPIDRDKQINILLSEFTKCVRSNSYEGTKKGSGFCADCPYKYMCKKKVI